MNLGRVTLVSAELSLLGQIEVSPAIQPSEQYGRSAGVGVPTILNLSRDGSSVRNVVMGFGPSVREVTATNRFFARVTREGEIRQLSQSIPSIDFDSEPPVGPVDAVAPQGRLVGYAQLSRDDERPTRFSVVVMSVEGSGGFSREYDFTELGISGPGELQALTLGRDTTIWIQLPHQDGVRPHLVLDRRGVPVGHVDLPNRSRLAVASLNRIWVLERDELDVESVVQYRVVW